MEVPITIAVTVFVSFFGYTESLLGKSCSSTAPCSQVIDPLKLVERCENSICRCIPGTKIQYNTSLVPVCRRTEQNLPFASSQAQCNSTSCGENEVCIDNGNIWLTSSKTCACKDGFLRFDTKCRKASYQKVLESCYIKEYGLVYLCDAKSNSLCQEGKCICFDSHFANITSGNCQPLEDYLEIFNLTEYRAKPREYCIHDDQCKEGLLCKGFLCSCPRKCQPGSNLDGLCDCNRSDFLSLHPAAIAAPIIGGVLFGAVLICGCILFIKAFSDQIKTKRSRQSLFTRRRTNLITVMEGPGNTRKQLHDPPPRYDDVDTTFTTPPPSYGQVDDGLVVRDSNSAEADVEIIDDDDLRHHQTFSTLASLNDSLPRPLDWGNGEEKSPSLTPIV